jgi:hypothetical protein
MRPQPNVLFNGTPLMQFAHTTTAAAVKTVENEKYEYLTAQPVDALIQRLYTENEIILPRLDRDRISYEHFESYIGPYVEEVPRDRTGKQNFKDLTRGILFAFEVGFVGDKRYFKLKPNKSEPTHPLAYVGDTTLTVYIPQRNNSVQFIQSAFEETLSLIDIYLQRQFETLRNFPKMFYSTLEAVISGRINRLKSTRDVVSALPYPPKSQMPQPTVVAPVAAPAKLPVPPVPQPESRIPPVAGNHTYLLLTGAGFSRNWGGPLASEVFEALLADRDIDGHTRSLLFKDPFEQVLADLQVSTAPEDQARYSKLITAVVGIFNGMNNTFLQTTFEFENPPSVQHSVASFLSKFNAIFTLNQDALIELNYNPMMGPPNNWAALHLPGMRFLASFRPSGARQDKFAVMEPNPSDLKFPGGSVQPYVKLHGSVNWVESTQGQRILIMGGQKAASIGRFPILTWYQEEFRKMLLRPCTRLMIIGYSFSDTHMNDAIAAGLEAGLELFIIDPAAKAAITHDPRIHAAQAQIIGLSARPLSGTFGGDRYAHTQIMQFFT